MATVNYRSLAGDILEGVGGEHNVVSATHCATRLRLRLRDETKADKSAIGKLPGVITVVQAGGQYQVVIGDNVPTVHQELMRLTSLGEDAPTAEEGPRGNLVNRAIDLISSILQPILWTLAGAGLLKAFLALANNLGWLDPASQSSVILAAAADGVFFLLPGFLAVTAAKRFGANAFTALAIAAALVHPSIEALAAAGEPVSFFGIPVVMMSYVSSVIPIIVAVWIQSHLERFLSRVLPAAVRNFTVPLLVLLVMVPLVLLTVGPVTMTLSGWLSSGINAAFGAAPWLAGAVMGGFWQVFVLFGLHWGFVPFMVNDLGTQGYSLMMAPLLPAVLAQAAATLAVTLRTRSRARRQLGGPAALSGFLAGVTEPAIYGVNLPLKLPFAFGIAGGIVGGAIVGVGGSAGSSFVFPSVIALPAFMDVGSFTMLLIGTALACAIAFALTWVFVDRESEDEDLDPGTDGGAPVGASVPGADRVAAGEVELLAPVDGAVVALEDVQDKVFASGVLGAGVAILPADGHIVAPVSGTVLTAMETGHAFGIRTDDGVEVLVHIGIDTVQLDGQHFTAHVTKGDRVKVGDVLADVDLAGVSAAGYDTTTVMVVTNTKKLTSVTVVADGEVATGRPAVLVTL
jgi:PTS system beta-glucosides-specific IIC component